MELETLNGIITIDLNSVTLSDVSNVISKLSVEGPEGAKTILYSGSISGCSSNKIVTDMIDVRIIDNTEVGKFLADSSLNSQFQQLLEAAIRNEITSRTFDLSSVEKGLYPDDLRELYELYSLETLQEEELLRTIELASNGYKFEPTKGAWAIASEKFIKETPIDSEIICITAEANITRTWAMVEVPTALENLPDNYIFGGYAVKELRQLRDEEGIDKVVELLKNKSQEVTEDIRLFYDENGVIITTDSSEIIGGTAIDMPEDAVFSTTIGDRRDYLSEQAMTTICPEYDNLTPLQKLQLQQLELDARNHDMSKLHDFVANDTAGNLKNVRITYDADGVVSGIDTSEINGGSTLDISKSNTIIDISSDGNVSMRLDKPSTGKAWWQDELVSIINNDSIKTINGVDARQFKNLYHNFSQVDCPNLISKLNAAIADISPTNIDGNKLLKNMASGKSQIADVVDDVPNMPGKIKGLRLGMALNVLGTFGDFADGAFTFVTACQQYKNGDMEGVHDTIGSWVYSTIGGAVGGYVAGGIAGPFVAAGLLSNPIGWGLILLGGILGGIAGEYIWDEFMDPLNDEYDEAGAAQPPRDPLVIDLGGLGIELTTIENGVHFDLDKNGFAEKTAWIGSEDGFLVLDRNGDGEINDGGELFGDQVQLENGLISISGFQALTELDENKDGIIDSNDSAWNHLRVWIDADQNGVSEGELKTLDALGITSIGLEVFKEQNIDSSTGIMEAEYAMVNFADGTQRKISEFWFPVDASDTTQNTEDGEIVDTIGNVPNIYTAIENDATGKLAQLYEKFASSKDFVEKRLLAKEILYFVTDSTDIEANSRGGNIDARDLHVIETFMGRGFSGVGGNSPNTNAAPILKDMYAKIERMYFNILNMDTEDGFYLNTIFVSEVADGIDFYDFSIIIPAIKEKMENGENVDSLIYSIGAYLCNYDEANGTKTFKHFKKYCVELSPHYGTILEASKASSTYIGTENADNIYGTNETDFVVGDSGDDTIYGHNGNDTIYGEEGNDTLNGGDGDDTIYGGEGNDILNGGYGNDTIYGGAGDDVMWDYGGTNEWYGGEGNDTFISSYGIETYHFDLGDGQDIIRQEHEYNDRKGDKIYFGESVNKEDI